MKYELEHSTEKRIKTFDFIKTLPLYIKKDDDKDYPVQGEYLVQIDPITVPFRFNKETGKFFLDTIDKEKSDILIKQHQLEVEGMTEEEKEKYLEGKYINFLIRVEHILLYGARDIADQVLDYINKYDI